MANIYPILLFLVCFAMRVVPRLVRPQARDMDTFFHLFFARKIRREGRLPRYSIPNFPYKAYYPWAYHRLLALFPLRWHERLEMVTGAAFDTLSAIIIYFFSLWVFRETGAAGLLSLAATALFVFSPALVRMGSGPRAYFGSPRVMGQTLYLAHIILAHMALATGSWLAGAGSLAAGMGLVMSAKFANQVLIFFGLVLAVVCSPAYLLFALGSNALALIVFKKTAWRILQAHVEHSLLYFSFLRHVFMGFAPRRFADYKKSWADHGLQKLRHRLYLRFLFWLLDEQYVPHYLLVCFLPVVFAPFAPADALPASYFLFLRGVAIAAFLWFLLTKTKLMMFLGEGERYLEYGIFAFILLAVTALRTSPFLGLLLGYTCLMGCVCAGRAAVMLGDIQTEMQKHREALDFLSHKPKGPLLVLGNSYYQAVYWGDNPVIGFSVKDEEALLSKDLFKVLWSHTPLPSYDFDQVLQLFSPRYFFGQAWAFDYYQEKVKDPDSYVRRMKKIYDNERVRVYEVVPHPQEGSGPVLL